MRQFSYFRPNDNRRVYLDLAASANTKHFTPDMQITADL